MQIIILLMVKMSIKCIQTADNLNSLKYDCFLTNIYVYVVLNYFFFNNIDFVSVKLINLCI